MIIMQKNKLTKAASEEDKRFLKYTRRMITALEKVSVINVSAATNDLKTWILRK